MPKKINIFMCRIRLSPYMVGADWSDRYRTWFRPHAGRVSVYARPLACRNPLRGEACAGNTESRIRTVGVVEAVCCVWTPGQPALRRKTRGRAAKSITTQAMVALPRDKGPFLNRECSGCLPPPELSEKSRSHRRWRMLKESEW